jgi:O-antigen/teichoic acid export membrane protein
MAVTEKAKTIRNAMWLVVQRFGLIVSGLAFGMIVPRLMGPDVYGRFALMMSLGAWSVAIIDLGFGQILSRYVPAHALDPDRKNILKLFGNLLVIRLFVGVAVAVAYGVGMRLFLHDIDRLALLAISVVILLFSMSEVIFQLFLGLNRAARWGAGNLLRRWLLVFFVPAGFVIGGLKGAAFGVLLADLSVLIAGACWAGPYFSREGLRVDFSSLLSKLRFGLVFFAGGLLLTAFRNTGAAIVRFVTDDYAQVGFFGISFSVYLAGDAGIAQVAQSFIPFLSSLAARRENDALRLWVERFLRGMTAISVPAVFGAFFLARQAVPLVFGPAYRPAAANLEVMSLALVAFIPGHVANLMSVVLERPGASLSAAGVRLAVFWLVGILLVAWRGSFGVCLAIFAAAIVFSVFITVRIRKTFVYSLGKWALAILVAVPFLALAAFRSSSWIANGALFAVATGGYWTLLMKLQVVTVSEIQSVWRAVVK